MEHNIYYLQCKRSELHDQMCEVILQDLLEKRQKVHDKVPQNFQITLHDPFQFLTTKKNSEFEESTVIRVFGYKIIIISDTKEIFLSDLTTDSLFALHEQLQQRLLIGPIKSA